MSDITDPGAVQEEAFRQVLAHRTMLMAYIRAIVRDPFLAEDAFSEATVAITRSWANYDTSRPFAPWSRGVARRVALAKLRELRQNPVALAPDVLEAVAGQIESFGSEAHLENRKEALRRCLAALSKMNRTLVRFRYFENLSYEQISLTTRRSVGALYVAFNRIHAVLRECIERSLEEA